MIGATVSHYKIIGSLGQGGMGVVYEAEDLKLGRRVAIKFLPEEQAEAAAHERFEREARAASSLNHENICTIYEFGEHRGRPFIAMELLEGQTLDRLLGSQPLPPDQILDYATQIADALDAAHRRGLVHRDIKPSNLFVTSRHRVKVLDFGLAKDTQTSSLETEAGNTATSAGAAHLTSPGSTVGTIAYMSPEQARGDELDGRSDLFSFGAVLYQMATGALPFEGKTSAVIFNSILEKQQVPAIEKNAAIPAKLDEIINKALEKDPDMRYQTAAEMRADLKRLRRDSSSGKTRAASTSSSVAAVPPPSSAIVTAESTASRPWLLLGGVAILLIVVAIVGGYLYSSRRSNAPKRDLAFSPLTDNGKVGITSISPDGKLLAYVLRDKQRSLHVKQIATGSDVEVVPPQPGGFGAIAFSPDGNYLYFAHSLPDAPVNALYVVPSLGGTAHQLLTGVAQGFGISPDGRQIAYSRRSTERNTDLIYVANVDGTGERKIGPDGLPHGYMSVFPMSWSPDGKFVTTAIQLYNGHLGGVVNVDVAGAKTEVMPVDIAPIEAMWLPDGSGLVLSGVARATRLQLQLYFLSYPKGELQRITNDLSYYQEVSVTADGKSLVTAQTNFQGDTYVAPFAHPDDIKPLGINKRIVSLAMIDNHRLIAQDSSLDFYTFNVDTGGLSKILEGDTLKQAPTPCPDGRSFLYLSIDDKNSVRVARAEYNSNTGTPITPGPLDGPAICLPDGQSFAYVTSGNGQDTLMKAAFNSTPVKIRTGHFDTVNLSPDRMYAVVQNLDDSKGRRINHALILSLKDDFSVVHDVELPSDAIQVDVTADNSAIVYVVRGSTTDNLWTIPVAGGAPKQLTHFTSDHISTYEISADGKTLVVCRGNDIINAVMLTNFH